MKNNFRTLISGILTKVSTLYPKKSDVYTKDETDLKIKSSTPSWNNLTDKPFSEETVESVIKFNGDLTDKEYYDVDDSLLLVRMSDDLLTIEQLIGSIIVLKHTAHPNEPYKFVLPEGDIIKESLDESNYLITIHDPSGIVAAVICGDLSPIGVMIPQGTYYAYIASDDGYAYTESISCLSSEVETIKPLDEKYIPDTIARAADIPEIPSKDEMVSAVIAALPIYNGEVESV